MSIREARKVEEVKKKQQQQFIIRRSYNLEFEVKKKR